MAMLINHRQWNIYFLIAGLENKYFFGKLECPWAHELTSQMGGEFISLRECCSTASAHKRGISCAMKMETFGKIFDIYSHSDII